MNKVIKAENIITGPEGGLPFKLRGQGVGLGLWPRPFKFTSRSTRREMNAGLIILRVSSERRDAQNERDGAVLRTSAAAATPSQQHYNLALKEKVKWKWSSSHRRVSPRGAAASTSRRDAAAPRGGTRAVLPRSISSVAAASTLSQQSCRRRQCPATMSGRRGLFF